MEWFVLWLEHLDVATVGIGNVGPFVPQLRASTIDRADLARDFEKYMNKRETWGQPWHPNELRFPHPDDHSAEADTRRAEHERLLASCDRFERELGQWHPARLPSVCMCMSASARLYGRSVGDIADSYGLAVESITHRLGTERSAAAARCIERGDRCWGQVGGWPWATFIDANGKGQMPDSWWTEPVAQDSLVQFLGAESARLQREAERVANDARVLRWGVRAADAA